MTEEISAANVTVRGLNAYLAQPKGGSTAGMLLLPMVTGIGEQVREYAETIAGTGVTALTWDPWHGPSSDDTPMDQLMDKLNELDDETALGEQRVLLDHLFGELGCTKAGVIGWCLGGRFALLLAAGEDRLANVVAYHPTVPTPPWPNHKLDAFDAAARITAPVMMLYPGADSLVPLESFTRLQSALNARTAGPSIVHAYPDAEHGFSSKARHGNPVNAQAFAISWPQALSLINVTTG